MPEIRIVVVDDHPLFRQGVADSLAMHPSLQIIGQAADGPSALKMIQELLPDVAVLDVNLPGLNGQQITHQIVQDELPTRVLLLTAYDDNEQIIHAAWAGAAAYCSKDVSADWLTRAVLEVAGGNYVIGEQVMNRKEFEHWLEIQTEKARRLYSEPGNPFHPLSEREMEVLTCIVRGMSNKEIAIDLGISHQTVKNHVTSILRKFGVEDRTQAVVYALKRGWVELRSRGKMDQE
jgi:two-component system, NarL family, response regulator DegU